MADYLIARGIDPDRIIKEDASTSTVENISNSMHLMEQVRADEGGAAPRVGIVTNNFPLTYTAASSSPGIWGSRTPAASPRRAIRGICRTTCCASSLAW